MHLWPGKVVTYGADRHSIEAMIWLSSNLIHRMVTSVITLEDWAMIKHMHKQGVPKSRIAGIKPIGVMI